MQASVFAPLRSNLSRPKTMPRLSVLPTSHFRTARTFVSAQRLLSSTPEKDGGKQNSTPGWEGRPADDHAVKRSPLDVQADSSKKGMEDKGKTTSEGGSQALSQKDERNSNQRAHEEHPEAPGPVIGMNSERGGKGH